MGKSNTGYRKNLANKVVNPNQIGGGNQVLGYSDLVMTQLGDIRRGFTMCAARGLMHRDIDALEAALQVLHAMTMPYHAKDYVEAYEQAMGTLKLMNVRDRDKRKRYFEILMAWYAAQLHQLKRMGLLMERSGIIDFET